MAPRGRTSTSSWLNIAGSHATLPRRDSPATASPQQAAPSCLKSGTCTLLFADHISLPRATFISVLTLCLAVTLTSLLALGCLLYRRRRHRRHAKTWGRKSRYLNRVSIAQKQLDDDFRRQYHGVFAPAVENPEMGSDSPVELGWEEPCWEVPNVEVTSEKRLPPLPPVPQIPESVRVKEGVGAARGSMMGQGRKSLFFCDGVGVWLHKR